MDTLFDSLLTLTVFLFVWVIGYIAYVEFMDYRKYKKSSRHIPRSTQPLISSGSRSNVQSDERIDMSWSLDMDNVVKYIPIVTKVFKSIIKHDKQHTNTRISHDTRTRYKAHDSSNISSNRQYGSYSGSYTKSSNRPYNEGNTLNNKGQFTEESTPIRNENTSDKREYHVFNQHNSQSTNKNYEHWNKLFLNIVTDVFDVINNTVDIEQSSN